MRVGDTVWIVERRSWWCNIQKRHVPSDVVLSALVISVCDNGDLILHYSRHSSHPVTARFARCDVHTTQEATRAALRTA